MGCPRALASPGARVVFSPLPDALDMGGACEVIAVVGLVLPAALAVGFAGLAALGLRAIALSPGAARIGIKAGLTPNGKPRMRKLSLSSMAPAVKRILKAPFGFLRTIPFTEKLLKSLSAFFL